MLDYRWALGGIKPVFMYLTIYPLWNLYYGVVFVINLVAPRQSTISIFIIAIMFYVVASIMRVSTRFLEFDSPDGNFSLDSMPCFGVKKGCQSIKVIVFTCIVMFPLFFWNREYLFGSTDCIDYNGMVDEIGTMMGELKRKRLDSKIDRTLDAVKMYNAAERRHIKNKITAMKEPLHQQIIDDRVSLLKSKNFVWATDANDVTKHIEQKFVDKLSLLETPADMPKISK